MSILHYISLNSLYTESDSDCKYGFATYNRHIFLIFLHLYIWMLSEN